MFIPSGKKYIFKVVPFGPKITHVFYTAMMQFLCDDWTILFNETRHSINLSNSPTNIVCDDRIIIDDILLFSNNWFETNNKPLRKMQREYHRKYITIIGWTPSLVHLFCDCKSNLMTSSLLLRYNSSRQTFLKTDWSTGGIWATL